MWYKIIDQIKDFLDFTKEFWIILLGSYIAMMLLFGAAIKLGKEQCEQLATQQELEWDFGVIKGCLVKKEGKWIDYEKYRIVK